MLTFINYTDNDDLLSLQGLLPKLISL